MSLGPWSCRDEETRSNCASKGGVTLLTKAIAIDHGHENIRANCICPSIVETELVSQLFNTPKRGPRKARRWATIPLGRMGVQPTLPNLRSIWRRTNLPGSPVQPFLSMAASLRHDLQRKKHGKRGSQITKEILELTRKRMKKSRIPPYSFSCRESRVGQRGPDNGSKGEAQADS